ncbi:16S rRNA (uracil(1498)-N(3))-methyltransferase [Tomitella fengzijianii]|uniref:Ribosomal RNA small subunit methyltransferase E n=1 Tax=Tomitella fengzijianii TaxID=2597660 RepID=A0A516X4M8_9ACTN|nr:16S rRNA (uracil(1498)-N(3))-methyltransferase [Tomitella fengzijianii]QDQ98017.1 16S rRNA (uracil(1498)-N(3))-methyltransferase [Tomitella fengzijianii]
MAGAVFYVDSLPAEGGRLTLDGPEGRHAATVRRFGPGDRLLLSDTRGTVAQCVVDGASRDALDLRCERARTVEPAYPRVTVVQALPKSERAELAVDLATEAGADAIVPWAAARCVARWKSEDKERKALAKWATTARAAAKQARRPRLPDVEPLHDTPALVRRVRDATAAGGLVMVLHESATGTLPGEAIAAAGDVTLIVGPEGGVDGAEIAALTEAGAQPVRLGPEVLRTSAAAAVALGAIGVLTHRWDGSPLESGD